MTTSSDLAAGLNAKPLRSAPRRLAASIAVLALGWPVLALADCVDTRKPTAAEMNFHSRAIAASSQRGQVLNLELMPSLGMDAKEL